MANGDNPSMTGNPRDGIALVFGASGYVGSALVSRLMAGRRPVRAAARNLPALLRHGWKGVDCIAADALDPASLTPAMAGVDVAWYLVHSMAAGGDFARLDREAATNFAAAAQYAGVRRIVYLGGLAPADADSEHLVSRRETGEILRRGNVPVIEVRAGIIVGPGSAAFEVMRDLVYQLPVMVTPRWVRSSSPPVALDDLLHYLEELPGIDAAAGRVLDAAGPETLTYEAMMRTVARVSGRRVPFIIPVPLLTPRLSSYWLRFVTSVPTNVARALIDGLQHDFTADTAPLRALVPLRPMGFEEAVAAALVAEKRPGIANRWSEGAFAMRKHRIDYAYYAKRASGSAKTCACPDAAWAVLSTIGGANRYFYFDGLWTLRESMDAMIGGPGLERGRRDPRTLEAGDKVDSWEVLGVEPSRRRAAVTGDNTDQAE